VNKNFREELKIVEEWLQKRSFYAIGEVGIDLYWDKTFREEQIVAFQHQIQLSLEHKLPLVIHSRNSFQDIFSSLENFLNKNPRGIFHSFTGTLKDAQRAIHMGFKIGINGIVSFKNSGLDKVVAEIGLDHLVLETDSPYLAPVPKRGKRNESSYLIYIAQKIAEITGENIEKVAKKTNQNAREVFGMEKKMKTMNRT
jgi:TatD DNase family protein